MGGRGDGGWRSQSCRLTRENTTNSQGRQEQDATRGRGREEGKLADVKRRCHKRQHSNQSEQTRGKWEVELPGQREAATLQKAAAMMRGWEAEAAQRDTTQQPAGCRGGGVISQRCRHRHRLRYPRKRDFPSKFAVNHAYSGEEGKRTWWNWGDICGRERGINRK